MCNLSSTLPPSNPINQESFHFGQKTTWNRYVNWSGLLGIRGTTETSKQSPRSPRSQTPFGNALPRNSVSRVRREPQRRLGVLTSTRNGVSKQAFPNRVWERVISGRERPVDAWCPCPCSCTSILRETCHCLIDRGAASLVDPHCNSSITGTRRRLLDPSDRGLLRLPGRLLNTQSTTNLTQQFG